MIMKNKLVMGIILVVLLMGVGCQSSDTGMPDDAINNLEELENDVNKSNVFDPFTTQEGDIVGDMKVISITATSLENNLNTVTANFDGKVAARGSIYNVTDEFLGDAIYFIPDEGSSRLFPKADIDERYIWFVFDDYEKAIAMYNENFGDTVSSSAIVEIDHYTINYAPSDVVNQATLVNIVE